MSDLMPDSFFVDLEECMISIDGNKLPYLIAEQPVTMEIQGYGLSEVTCTFIVPNDTLTVLPKRKKDE